MHYSKRINGFLIPLTCRSIALLLSPQCTGLSNPTELSRSLQPTILAVKKLLMKRILKMKKMKLDMN